MKIRELTIRQGGQRLDVYVYTSGEMELHMVKGKAVIVMDLEKANVAKLIEFLQQQCDLNFGSDVISVPFKGHIDSKTRWTGETQS